MAAPTAIRLKWEYWIYQALAVLGFIVPLTWYILLVPPSPFDPFITMFRLSLPTITCVAFIYSTLKLKQGVISSWLKVGWKVRRPVRNIHRVLIGWILFSSSLSITFGPYIHEVSWLYLVVFVSMILGFWLSASGY